MLNLSTLLKKTKQERGRRKPVNNAEEERREKLYSFISSDAGHKKGAWIVSTACTNHMTYDRSLFVNFENESRTKVDLINGAVEQAQGKGDVVIKTQHGELLLIADVLYVPGLVFNCLSVGQLAENGYGFEFEFGSGRCEITKDGKEVLTFLLKENSGCAIEVENKETEG